jgi:uncharacterized membrane protein YedE/YeeE
MAGSVVVSGEGNIVRIFMYLGIGAVVLVLISLIPGWIKKRSKPADPEKEGAT